jgi:hypothetical protein
LDGAIVQVAPDGTIQYRASGLANCTKALVAARLGYEPLSPPEGMAARFREGHDHEPLIVRNLEEIGYKVYGREASVELVVTSRIKVTGHIDGVAYFQHSSEGAILEMKTQSQDAWDEFERRGWESGFFPKYKLQVSVYMNAMMLPLLLVRKNRNTGEVKTESVVKPFYTRLEIKQKVLAIEAAARAAMEPPAECDARMYPCPYYYLHEDESDRELVVLDDPGIDVLAKEYADAAVEAKRAKARQDAARKGLRAGLESDKVVTATGVKVSFYQQKNPPFIDKQKMAAAGLNPDDFISQGTSERIRVTLPKGEDND